MEQEPGNTLFARVCSTCHSLIVEPQAQRGKSTEAQPNLEERWLSSLSSVSELLPTIDRSAIVFSG